MVFRKNYGETDGDLSRDLCELEMSDDEVISLNEEKRGDEQASAIETFQERLHHGISEPILNFHDQLTLKGFHL